MTGKKYRAVSLEGEHRYYNCKLPIEDLDILKDVADSRGMTVAHLVREAIRHWMQYQPEIPTQPWSR